jgi:hypothetical protein
MPKPVATAVKSVKAVSSPRVDVPSRPVKEKTEDPVIITEPSSAKLLTPAGVTGIKTSPSVVVTSTPDTGASVRSSTVTEPRVAEDERPVTRAINCEFASTVPKADVASTPDTDTKHCGIIVGEPRVAEDERPVGDPTPMSAPSPPIENSATEPYPKDTLALQFCYTSL